MEETTSTISYTVKSENFEGPLDLLLNLVEKRKLFINEVSLGTVTDEYLTYARGLQNQDLSELTSFLSIAATLILIKSRSLLPGFIVTEEEEKDIKDLESRLSLYALIRTISTDLSVQYGKTIIHLPPERTIELKVFAPDPALSVAVLHGAVRDVLGRVPKEVVLPEVRVRKVISIDDMITKLSERIAQAASVSFRSWQETMDSGTTREEKKGNVIVSFLAMLELVRQGFMDAIQNTEFEDIALSKITQSEELNHESI